MDKLRVLEGPGVWMEGAAKEQLRRVSEQPGCVATVGMPDLHAGPGIPIGAVFAFADGIHPPLIGGDAGCGALLVGVPHGKHTGDALERRILEQTEAPVLAATTLEQLAPVAWAAGPRGLSGVAEIPEELAAIAAMYPVDDLPPSGPVPPDLHSQSLGTTGGGNHFLELVRIGKIWDRPVASRAGVQPRGLAVLAHSGSRGLGKMLADGWEEGPLRGAQLEHFTGQLVGAIRWAQVNRLLLAWRMLLALGTARAERLGGLVDLVHNSALPRLIQGQALYLHRKGVAPAEAGMLTVVLGSRGTPSFLMEGAGAESCLCSVAHGAGRKMGRTEARAKLKSRYTRASLTRTALGGRVHCDDPELLYEEHPDAYKAVEPVIEALEAAGAARRVAELLPLFTLKR
jgi:release factor H-coupled RctB family protein